MGETDHAGLLRDRDENKPDPGNTNNTRNNSSGHSGRDGVNGHGLVKYRAPLNSSASLLSTGSSCLGGGGSSGGDSLSSSSSKSNSPDHVVPHEHPHRLSTSSSSGSSSPQTDGSITYRRYVGPPDGSRGNFSSSGGGGGRSVDEPVAAAASPTARKERKKAKPGPRKSANAGITAAAAAAVGINQEKRLPKRKPVRKNQIAGLSERSGRKAAAAVVEENAKEESESDYVIRCICGYDDILDEQIQCDKCEAWQHFGCMGVEVAAVPDCYLCELCDPAMARPWRADEARQLHQALLVANARTGRHFFIDCWLVDL